MSTRLTRLDARFAAAVSQHRALLERRVPNTISASREVVVEACYSPFSVLAVGRPYGLYGERIRRFEVVRDGPRPSWYTCAPDQMAWHHPEGGSAYIEIETDAQRRSERHPFENVVKGGARRRSVQAALFEN